MNVHRHHGQDILPNMTRAPHVKYITYYEDAESLPGWRTAVWELDKGANLVFFLLFYIVVALFPVPVILHCNAARESLRKFCASSFYHIRHIYILQGLRHMFFLCAVLLYILHMLRHMFFLCAVLPYSP